MATEFRFFAQETSIPFLDPEALSNTEKLLATYINSSAIGFCVLDADLRYLAINDALARMNGIPAADHLGKAAREVIGELADTVEPLFRRVLSTGEPVIDFELTGDFPGTKDVGHWLVYFFPLRDKAGNVSKIGIFVFDVTKQRQMELAVNKLGQQLKQQEDRMRVMSDISGILSANWNVQQVFPAISARLRRVFRHEYASFSLHDASSGLLVRQALDFPLSKGFLSNLPISAHDSPGGRSLQHLNPVIYSRDELRDFKAEISRGFLEEGIRSLCCIPLLRPKGALGILTLGSTRQDAFRLEDMDLLNQVAAQLGIALENHRAAAEIDALKQRLAQERAYLEGEIRSQGEFTEIVGESPALKQVLDQIATVAPSDATVLILGETGTGKELIARAIHRMSRRKNAAFIKVNCAAIPTGLLESELFGHEKGAFTGAISQKVGRLELADGGTLFLDEIGEIALELQPKLLRVLQDQEFERLGGTRTIHVNVRLVAATNRDLARSVAEREFRNDLFYRLNVFPVRIPALRERPQDVPLLVRYFVRKFARRMDRHIESVPKESMAALLAWHWPGNVRELENLMERSVILTSGRALAVPALDETVSVPQLSALDDSLNTAEREHILRVLRETGGLISGPNGAARRLGLKRTTLQSKMQRLRITRGDYKGPGKDKR